MRSTAFQNRLRISGVLISTGILVEMVTLFRAHPLSFVAFIVFGGGLVSLGIVVYLFSLASFPSSRDRYKSPGS